MLIKVRDGFIKNGKTNQLNVILSVFPMIVTGCFRFLIFALAFIQIGVLAPGCATDQVTWDLTEYLNQDILSIAELEKRPLERYASARGDQYTTDEHLCDVLEHEVIPEYKRFLGLLKQIQPKNKEVGKLHYVYVQGTESIYRGFKLKMLGLEKGDELIIREGNDKIEQGRRKNEQWRNEISALYEAHGIWGVRESKR